MWSYPTGVQSQDLKHATFKQKSIAHHRTWAAGLSGMTVTPLPFITANTHTLGQMLRSREFLAVWNVSHYGKYNESSAQTPTSTGVKEPQDRSSRNHTSLPPFGSKNKNLWKRKEKCYPSCENELELHLNDNGWLVRHYLLLLTRDKLVTETVKSERLFLSVKLRTGLGRIEKQQHFLQPPLSIGEKQRLQWLTTTFDMQLTNCAQHQFNVS